MNQRQKPRKRKGATAAAVLCFVAAIAMVGTYTFKDYREAKQEEKLAQAEETKEVKENQENSEEASGEAEKYVLNREEAIPMESEAQDASQEDDSENETDEADDTESEEKEETPSSQTSGNVSGFDSESSLLWPVDGNILLNYSMDKTVYFSTLDQYKYNPALIISGAENDQVLCGAPGVVKSIDVTAQTGTTVNVDLGNGYELFYGQLKEVPVKVGDSVSVKSVLGYVSQPTKYYSVEGCNVYFEMRKDGQPVNPMDYLVE